VQTFNNCKNLKKVSLPETLTSVKNIFRNCQNLENVIFPDIKDIEAPFENCRIKNITIGKNCKNLTFGSVKCENIEISPDNKVFTSIDGFVYTKDKTKLLNAPRKFNTYKLPNETIYIDNGVFSDAQITSLDLNNVVEIGSSVFENAKVENLIANNLQKVSKKSFRGIDTNNIEIKNLKYIDEAIFANATIKNIILSDNVTTICYGAFMNAKIEKFVCPKQLTLIDSCAFENSTLKEITFNDKLSEIGNEAFVNCLLGAEIYLPNSLKSLGYHAFTYSPDALYFLNKNIEYNDGIDVQGYEVCNNILIKLTSVEKNAYFEGTNLENIEIGTIKPISELIEDGLSFKEANKIYQMLNEK